MRKITLLKTLLLAFALIVGSVSATAQLLVENFDYTVGSVLTATATADATTGWLSHSGNGTANIDVTSGLSFTGYAGSGIGGAANLDATGQDINKVFTAQTSGSLYVAFLLKVNSNTSAGYYIHLGPSPLSTTFYSRIWINATGTGLGLTAGSTAPTAYTAITAGSTYIVVLKHDFTANTSSMYILNSFSSTEPVAPDVSVSETVASIGSFALRQNSSTQNFIVDGIRVGTTWADACAAPSGTPKAATPTFTALPGNVISSQTVGIESATAGAAIYYTTNGDDPTIASTVYSTPITVSATTTVKALAVKSGYDNSSIGSATYTFPTEIATVSALRAASTSGFYKLTGEAVLTYQSTAGKVKFIQDATAGIMIYDGSNKVTTAYNLGDGLKNIYCTLSMFNGTLEIIPFNDFGAANSINNVVTPTVVTLANIANYQGQLVTVNNLLVTGTGNWASATSYVINDGTAGKLRVAYSDLPYIGAAIPTTALDVTGVVYNYAVAEVDIVPRTAADIAAALGTRTANLSDKKSVFASNGSLQFTSAANQTVEVYNAVGQKLVSRKTVEGLNTIPMKVSGVVFVKLGTEVTKVIM